MLRRIGNVVGGRSPVAVQIVAVHHHLRLVVGLRAGERGIHVQILRPGVVRAELQAMAETVDHVHLQRVVAAVAFGVPEESRAQIGIGPGGAGPGMYCAPWGTMLGC